MASFRRTIKRSCSAKQDWQNHFGCRCIKSVAFWEGFLDHPHPSKQGKVLFIGSDSGAGPVKAVLQSAGHDHPFFKEALEQRFTSGH